MDGYYEINGDRIALEYLGCFWHGCNCRFNPNELNPVSKIPYGVLRRQSDNKMDVLRKTYNLKVHTIWDCQWEKAKQNDPDVRAFISNYEAPERLNPRESLFGGRTNALKLYHKATEDERVSYLDFTSLYPFVQSCKTYPIGHPEIILKDFEPVESYFGLIKCTVLPPRKLLHPLIPFKSPQGKLLFALCRTCAEQQLQESCQHSDEERSISGVWTSVELSHAVVKGYSVVKIVEVWHFPQTSDDLFSGYVKTFLKFKQRGELLTEPEDFARHIFGNCHVIKHFSFVSDSVALVQWCYTEDDPAPARDVNIFIVSFTTAYGRLELYEFMDRLGPHVFYVDTDSLIFSMKEGEWMPQTGSYLGELTNELDADDNITEFATTGPKSYSFKTVKNKVTLKAKGVMLHSSNAQIITLESMICLLHAYVTSRDTTTLLTRTETIVRNKKKFTLHNSSL